MFIIIITGSGGLIGSEAVKFFSKKFSKVIGIDNDMRSYFFGKSASVEKNISNLKKQFKNYSHYDLDIGNFAKVKTIFKKFNNKISFVIHCARHNLVMTGPLMNHLLISQLMPSAH